MSSAAVRQSIEAAVVAAAAPLPVFDLSDYVSSEQVLSEIDSQAVLIQYVTADEQQQNIGGEGNQGWIEQGTVVLHIVTPVGFDSGPITTQGDTIREALRGKRIDPKIVIESCSPFTDMGGSAVGLSGGAWKGWSANLFYEKTDCG